MLLEITQTFMWTNESTLLNYHRRMVLSKTSLYFNTHKLNQWKPSGIVLTRISIRLFFSEIHINVDTENYTLLIRRCCTEHQEWSIQITVHTFTSCSIIIYSICKEWVQMLSLQYRTSRVLYSYHTLLISFNNPIFQL